MSVAAALAERYRVERELGQGGMATVYLAHDLKHARPVAIKVLRSDVATSIGSERFLREIQTLAALHHPHILGLLDSGQIDDSAYYVMPFVEGGSLRDRLNRERQLPIGDVIRIASEIATALDYAHRHGLIHRDIKPENILLHDGQVLVADFGIALDVSPASTTRMTGIGLTLGTPHYMSPEQATGEWPITARSDVYALGALTYEMLIGEPPFTGSTSQAVLVRMLTEKPSALHALRDTVPHHVEAAVLTALHRVPADRFASAADFHAALVAPTTYLHPGSGLADHQVTGRTFKLSEDTSRRLSRASFDPRLIGSDLSYLDNGAPSDVLVCFIPACGRGGDQFKHVLRHLPYRGVAPTFRGFETSSEWRPALPIDDHIVIIREFLHDAVKRLEPRVTLIAGFSSGADFALRFAAHPDPDRRLRLDGCVALGANLSLETCFVTNSLAALRSNDDAMMLEVLRGVADRAASLDEWIDICEYMTRIVPVFRHDLAPLQRFGEDISAPFRDEAALVPFARWYRAATARGCSVRCVFEDTPMYRALVRELQLRNLDEGLLGEHYEELSVISETAATHFDLIDPRRISRHLEVLVRRVAAR